MKNTFLALFVGIFINLCLLPSAAAHNGEHHNSSCFFNIADTKLRLNGYYLNNKLAGKHFCRIYPANGHIVFAVDVLADGLENHQLALHLSELAPWSQWSTQFFTELKQLPATAIGSGLLALDHNIDQPNLYALDVVLYDATGRQQSQRFYLVAGIPVTLYLIYFAGLLLLVIAFVWLRSLLISRK